MIVFAQPQLNNYHAADNCELFVPLADAYLHQFYVHLRQKVAQAFTDSRRKFTELRQP